jgi:hypothetical protein
VRYSPGSSLEWDPSNLTPFIAAGDFVSPESETPTLPRPIRHLKNFDQSRIKAANQNPNWFLEPFFETFQAYFCNCMRTLRSKISIGSPNTTIWRHGK